MEWADLFGSGSGSAPAEAGPQANEQRRTIIGEITADILAPAARDFLSILQLREQVRVARAQIEQRAQLAEIAVEQNPNAIPVNWYGHQAPIDDPDTESVIVPAPAAGLPAWAPLAVLGVVALLALR